MSLPREAWAQAPARSAADIAQARELFNQAEEQRDRGDVQGALEKFKAAHALGKTPVTGVELGRTYLQLGMLIEAHETFLAVGRLTVSPDETSRSAQARSDAQRLADVIAPRIPSVTITITGAAPDQTAVTIDGASVPTAALAAPRLLDPGSHTIAATSGGQRTEVTVKLQEGDSKPVELKVVPAPLAPPPAVVPPTRPEPEGAGLPSTPPEPVRRTLSPLVWIGGGVGAVGIAVGASTGIVAMSKASAVKNACYGLLCPYSIDGDLSSGRTLANVSTIAFAVGGAGVATMVVGFFLGGHRQEAARLAPWVGPGSAGVGGTF